MQWNVAAGGAMHQGRTDTGLGAAVVEQALASGAQFISLNELCHPQYVDIAEQLVVAGFFSGSSRRHHAFAPSKNTTCMSDGHTGYGNAIFSRTPLGMPTVTHLKHSKATSTSVGGNERRTVICAPERRSVIVFCGTHLTTEPALVAAQLNQVARLGGTHLDAGSVPVVAGDFNVVPSDTAAMLHHFVDIGAPEHRPTAGMVAAPGEPARTPKTLDYVFVPERHRSCSSRLRVTLPSTCLIPKWSTALEPQPCSDHRVVIATFTLQSPVPLGELAAERNRG
jgi:endonuclease/exonuclease/phosphatase family metal-dependent hydrolase